MDKYKKARVGPIFYMTFGDNEPITLETFIELFGVTQEDFPTTEIVNINIWGAGSLTDEFDLMSFRLNDECADCEEYIKCDSFDEMIDFFLL
jgi:hypothetical protein